MKVVVNTGKSNKAVFPNDVFLRLINQMDNQRIPNVASMELILVSTSLVYTKKCIPHFYRERF